MPDPTAPDTTGAQNECATCGHRRYRHQPDHPDGHGSTPCGRMECACGGHFVELSYGTRMAHFVEAAQQMAASIVTVRGALQDTMRATTQLYAAMKEAGLLPEDDQHDHIREAAGRHAIRDAAVATLAEAFDVPAEMLTGPSPDGLPDHWTGAAPLPATRNPFGRTHNQSSPPDLRPIGSGPTEHHHPAEADPEATQAIPAVESPEPSGKQPARLWSWDAGTGGWVQIDSGPAEEMGQGRDRRYQTAANNDIPGAAWLVRAPGDKPTGHPDHIGVPTT